MKHSYVSCPLSLWNTQYFLEVRVLGGDLIGRRYWTNDLPSMAVKTFVKVASNIVVYILG